MSYKTQFEGSFSLEPALTAAQCAFLRDWSEQRHEGKLFPSVWCEWVPSEDGSKLAYSENDGSFYNYDDWLVYLIEQFFKPIGVVVLGEVAYQGEEAEDRGMIYVHDNQVRVVADKITRAENPFLKSK